MQVEDSTLTDNLIKQKYLLDVSQKNLIKYSKDQVHHLKKGYLINPFDFAHLKTWPVTGHVDWRADDRYS